MGLLISRERARWLKLLACTACIQLVASLPHGLSDKSFAGHASRFGAHMTSVKPYIGTLSAISIKTLQVAMRGAEQLLPSGIPSDQGVEYQCTR